MGYMAYMFNGSVLCDGIQNSIYWSASTYARSTSVARKNLERLYRKKYDIRDNVKITLVGPLEREVKNGN